MCPEPAIRPQLVDSIAVVATVLVAVFGAAATVFAAPAAEPVSAFVASAAVASRSASPR